MNDVILKIGIELLWTNNALNSAFSAQTVNVDTTKFSKFYILTSYKNDGKYYYCNEVLNVKGIKQIIATIMGVENRRFCVVTESGIIFESGSYISNTGFITDDANAVPSFIYGSY